MTKEEVFKDITTPLKWYEPNYTAQYACILKSRFSNGKLGEKAIKKLFNKYGYKLNQSWEKQ